MICIGAGVILICGKNLSETDINKYLQDRQKNYDWLKDPTNINSQEYEDTIVWDGLQHAFVCCGINNASNWDSFRPKLNTTEDLYPRSCCDDPTKWVQGAQFRLCLKKDTYTYPCYQALVGAWKISILILAIISSFYILVAGIAHLIIQEIEDERGGRYKHNLAMADS